MFGAVYYYITPAFLLLAPVLGKDDYWRDSLLVVDNKYIYQFPVDALMNSTKYEHNSQSSGLIHFLTVRNFQKSFIAVFGGCDRSAVGFMIKTESTESTESTFVSQLPLNSSVGVCYAAPGFNNVTFYALLKSQDIVLYDSNDYSLKVVSQSSGETKCPRSNLQLDYKKHFLYYLDCSQNNTQFLRVLNITSNVENGKSLTKAIKKFEIDFISNEVFAIDTNVVLKGKLGDSKTINLEVFHTAALTIVDLALSPRDVYIMFAGGKGIQIVRRSESTSVTLNFTIDESRALAYLGVTSDVPVISLSNSIKIWSTIAWILYLDFKVLG